MSRKIKRNATKQGRRTRFEEQRINSTGLASLANAARATDDVKTLIRAIHHAQDAELAQDVAEYLDTLALEQELDPDPFAPAVEPELARGELELGLIRNSGCTFGLYPDELGQHVLVVGRSGSGKTTFTTTLLKQLLCLAQGTPLQVRILVFDIKRDYQRLTEIFPNIWLFKLPGKGLRWNPLEPPIKNRRRWAGILASSLANSLGFFGGMGTENFIFKHILELYRKYDVDSGVYPCMLDLLDYLNLLKNNKKIDRYSEEFKWFVRFLNRIESLCEAFEETVNCSRGYPICDILAHHTIFDLAEMKPDAQGFFVETFLNQIIWHRAENEERGGILRTVAVFDEAKRLMPRYREESQQAIANMSYMIAMAREFGVGLVVAECDPSLLANSIKSSCYSRFCFNQTHGRDIRDSAEALKLDPEQTEEIQKLDVGEAIVRVAGRIKRPFVLQVQP